MTPGALLAVVVDALDRAGIAHMLAGSVASSYHGEPRSTQDIDLVIDPDRSSLRVFLNHLEETGLYVGDGMAALRGRTQFNIIDSSTGWKADLIIRHDRPFSRIEMDRREPAEIFGCQVFVASAEDTILAKLEWAAQGSSDRQLRDVEMLLRLRADDLDNGYLDEWSTELGVSDALRRSREAAGSGE